MTQFTLQLESQLSGLRRQIQNLTDELEHYPAGGLYLKQIKGYFYFYRTFLRQSAKDNRPTQQYLSEKRPQDAEIIALLARKSFVQRKLTILLANEAAVAACLEAYTAHDYDAIRRHLPPACRYYLEKNPHGLNANGRLVLYSDKDAEIRDWLAAPYEKNPRYPQNLIHTTVTGEKVRSKSEAIILEKLWQYGIPYRYEAALRLDGITYYPDFTILHPVTKELWYLEHFGLLSNEGYAFHSNQKLFHYEKKGITLWNNLLLTYDKPDGSLDICAIDRMLRAVFPVQPAEAANL